MDEGDAWYDKTLPRASTEASTPLPVSPFLSKIPLQFQHTCTPEQIVRRVYGIEPGWRCTGCARPYEVDDYNRGHTKACPGCEKPLPRRCTNKGCDGLIEPLPAYGRGRGKKWYDGGSKCAACLAEPIRVGLAATLAERLPTAALDAALAWQPDTAWRRAVSAIVAGWAKGQRNITMLYIHGPSGTGKTVAGAFAVRRLFMALGRQEADFVFTTEGDLLEAHRALYFEGDELWKKQRAERAVDLLAWAKTKPLVVIDEMWKGGAGAYTDKQIERMFDILSFRTDNRLWTVICSNIPYWPAHDDKSIWQFGFGHGADRMRGDAMASRFGQRGEEIEANGIDRRLVRRAS